jgi:dihydroorotase (multifunctional complex type)
MIDLRIDGGRLVRPRGEPRVESIAVRDGRIVALGEREELRSLEAREVIDADGLHVFPGVIDTHFHIGFTDPDREWETEPRAAARGGVTTLLVYFRSLDLYDDLLPQFIEQAQRDSVVDFAVHLGILHDGHLERFRGYVERFGLRSLKMYTTYKGGEMRQFGILGQDDGFILDVLRAAAAVPNFTVNVHCENEEIVERGRSHWVDRNLSELGLHSLIRPPIAEVEAIRRMSVLARSAGARLFIPHVSSAEALAAAVDEREAGTRLHVETCPHYLLAEELQPAGPLAKVNPPVRRAADADALWAAIAAENVDVVGSDHAATMEAGKRQDILVSRPGFPGSGLILPVLADGIAKGRISYADYARLQANAAHLFSLPTKGLLRVGFDADLVLVDMTERRAVDAGWASGVSDFSPYAGLEFTGWPVRTIRRGRTIAPDVEDPGRGRYLRWDA